MTERVTLIFLKRNKKRGECPVLVTRNWLLVTRDFPTPRRATGHGIAQYLLDNKNPPDGGFCRQTISRILFCPGPVVSNQPRVASIISLHNVLPQNVKPSTRSRVWDPQLGTYLRLLRIEISYLLNLFLFFILFYKKWHMCCKSKSIFD